MQLCQLHGLLAGFQQQLKVLVISYEALNGLEWKHLNGGLLPPPTHPPRLLNLGVFGFTETATAVGLEYHLTFVLIFCELPWMPSFWCDKHSLNKKTSLPPVMPSPYSRNFPQNVLLRFATSHCSVPRSNRGGGRWSRLTGRSHGNGTTLNLGGRRVFSLDLI